MPLPRRFAINAIAIEAGVENPGTISAFELKRKLIEMPKENWAGIDPDSLISRLDALLDGARPIF